MVTRSTPELQTSRKPVSLSPKVTQSTGNGAGPSREEVFDLFRRWGFLQASLDPLGQFLPAEPFPTPAPEGPYSAEARTFYCGTIGAEFMHIAAPEKRAWIQAQLERPYKAADTKRILTGRRHGPRPRPAGTPSQRGGYKQQGTGPSTHHPR